MGNRKKYIINRSLPIQEALKIASKKGLTFKDLLDGRTISLKGTINPRTYDTYGPINLKITATE